MRRLPTLLAAITTGLLVLATVAPAAAADGDGKASGWIKWYGTGDTSDVRTSSFRVVDGTPGDDYSGDSGWFYLKRKGVGTFWLDVSCVEVHDDWAEFAGTITRRTGKYRVGQWWLVSVVDTRSGRDDAIGMGGRKKSLDAACAAATDGVNMFGRQGDVYRGRIRVSDPR